MAVVVARMVAQLEAETAGFHARMTAAEQQLGRWTSSTTAGRRGVMVLNNALQQLTFQAAGIPGVVGKAASAIGVLGLGTGPVMLAVAALGALAVVFDRAAKSAEEFVAEAGRVREFQMSHVAMLAGIGPEGKMTRVEQIQRFESMRDRALGMQKALEPAMFGLSRTGEDPTEVAAKAVQRFNALTTTVNNLTAALRELRREEEAAKRAQTLEERLFLADTIALERGKVFQALRPGFNAPAFGTSAIPQLGGPATFANIRSNVPRFVPGDPKKTPGLGAEFYALSAMALVQGMQSGSVGGFLGAAAAPAAMINPLAGVITGTLGTLFSMFEGRETERERQEERRHKELIGVLHEGPARYQVLSADDPEGDLYAIRHQERLGGEPRLGGL